MFKGVWSLCLSLGLLLATGAQAASVLFLNPGLAQETFWVSYSRFMQAAAADLGMELHVAYAERDPERVLALARDALQGANKPDYLVFVNEQYVAPEVIRLSQGSGVKLFMVNNGLTESQARTIEAHPQTYGPVLGAFVTNDEEAGYRMLRELVSQLPPSNEPVELLAFSGVATTPASQLREQGMRRALADFPQVRLRQVVYGGWSRQRAFEQAQLLLKRYPQVRLVWSANDEMAFGAMQAFESAGRLAGRDVLFSAVNSSPDALRARIDGRLSALMGGHFTLGGLAMVMLHDDALGLAASRDARGQHHLPVLQSIDRTKAKRWLALFDEGAVGVDFARYSAAGRPADYRYPFLTSPVEY